MRVAATLVVAGALIVSGCRDAAAPRKQDSTITVDTTHHVDTAFTLQSIGLEFPVFGVGQQQGFLAITKGVDNVLVPGVTVVATLPTGKGTLVDSTVVTDANGAALFTWNTPTVSGTINVSFKGTLGGHSVTASKDFSVFPGVATHVTAASDSLRFTSVGTRTVQVNGFDQYDNATGLNLFVPPGTVTATLSGTSLSVASGSADTTAAIELRSSAGTNVKTVKAVSDFVVNAVQLVGGIDTLLGLGVGETKKFKFTAMDSAGAGITVSAAKAGIQFSSSDTTKLSVSAAGDVTGKALGAANVTATRNASSLSLVLNVFAGYDLGAVSTLFVAPGNFEGQSAGPVVVTQNGGALVPVTTCQTHPSGPCTSRVYWYSPTGASLLSRVVSDGAAVARSHDGGSYVSAPLARYDSSSGQRWTSAIIGSSLDADSTLVVVGEGNSLHAVTVGGADLWTTPTAAAAVVLAVAPTRIYASVGTNLAAFARTGAPAWEVPSPGAGFADENSVYFAVNGKTVAAIGPDGATKWTYTADIAPVIALGANASLIVATANKLRWLDRVTGAEGFNVTVPTSAARMASTATRVFVAASGGYLNVYDASSGAYLGRSLSAVSGGPFSPVCTSRGLAVAAPGYNPSDAGTLSRFARCQ